MHALTTGQTIVTDKFTSLLTFYTYEPVYNSYGSCIKCTGILVIRLPVQCILHMWCTL